MSDFYGEMADIAAELLAEFKQGVVTVTRVAQEGEKPDDWPSWEPWTPPTVTRLYEVDAVVTGVPEKLVDGDTVVATDLLVTCSDAMRLVSVDGEAVEPESVPFDAGLLDTLQIDGRPATVIQPMPVPAAGVKVVHKFVVRG